MTDIFDEMVEPDASESRLDKAGNVKRNGAMWVPKPAANSLSLAIHAMRICDSALQHDIDFIEMEVEGEWVAPRAPVKPEDERLVQARSALASMYIEHESIAESLGPESRDIYDRYVAICKQEGLTPIVLADYRAGATARWN